MRSALLLSIVSVALLGLFGWARQDRVRSTDVRADTFLEGEDPTLFIG
ncbi:MAG: hypothetical protein PVJ64_06100 [Gemmatimonadales bacterium]|jgi:hypothetical protein